MTPTPLSDSEELEKVARAMFGAVTASGDPGWDAHHPLTREVYRKLARAAIEAMRSHSKATGDVLTTQVPEAVEGWLASNADEDSLKFAEAFEAELRASQDRRMHLLIDAFHETHKEEMLAFSRIRKQHDTARYVGPGSKA